MPGSGFSAHPPSEDPGAPLTYALGDFCIDEYKPIKVVVIGAGFSGITAGIRFPQKIPNVQLTIYEKSAGVGGTWYNNNYPGLACDVPAHCYQLSFADKRDWSGFYASGPEIQQHLQDLVDQYKLMRYIRLQHEVVRAEYETKTGKWNIRVRRSGAETGSLEEFEESADVLVTAFGVLSRWKWPEIVGLHDFKGELHHSAGFEPQPHTWQKTAEAWKDKKVGVIGVGSSALQIVAALQSGVKKLVNYSRGRTWLSYPFMGETMAELLGREPGDMKDYRFTPEEIARFEADPEFARKFRLTLETGFNSLHSWTMPGTPLQLRFQAECRKHMLEKLAKKPWIAEQLIPDFPVACRRLTPGPGYLEALCEDNVDFVSSPIECITAHGIETEDGERQDLDVIVCATGYDTSFQLPFKILGRDGVDINERWKPHPVSYLSVAVDGFPNMFMALGPNSNIASGMLIPLLEAQVMYAVQATAKIQRERLKSMEVKTRALRDFDQYLETVFNAKCRSWYKMGKEDGRVAGLWPGSPLHGIRALTHPRWEDYNYELEDAVENRLYWLGDGQTYNEKTLTGDRAWYLHEPYLDIPPDGTTPTQPYTLGDFCIDEYRPLKVIVIGAGFSGILAGIRFPQKIPGVEITIYEKSEEIGGTWYNNNYPHVSTGMACDVPAHNYQFSFEQKKDWTSFYPTGPEICQHLRDIVSKHQLMRYIRLQHEVTHAQYDAPAGKWHVRVRVRRPHADRDTGAAEEIADSADVLLAATGVLSRWTWPDIAGLHEFGGELLHSAGFERQPRTWQDVAEGWKDKTVAVIGAGSSALQMVPALQPRVKKLVQIVRGSTWLAAPFSGDTVAKLIGRDPAKTGEYRFTPEEIERFKNEPGFFENFRLTIENEFNSTSSLTWKNTPLQRQTQEECRKLMEQKLAVKPWIAEKLIPDFPVSCRRLTPGPGYLEALCEDNVDFVASSITRVDATGIETEDGRRHDADVIICATGYDTSYALPFPILGRDSLPLTTRWQPHPETYLSVAVDGFPNLFFALGPNAVIATGTLLPLLEAQVAFAVQAAAKMRRERLRSVEVRAEAVRAFDEYLEAYFPRTVFTDKCRSWYKLGKVDGRVVALWPGSTLHGTRALEHPRWEDFAYELADPVQNRFFYLGDGQTHAEKTLEGDRAWYLRPPYLDVPPCELWYYTPCFRVITEGCMLTVPSD
ncbi:hypothetical protein C8Q78DRAFT_982944 [Trametes maxima]|nr:hypothetical protein C8Q78DRAFT_982944 [Trametes maxima]